VAERGEEHTTPQALCFNPQSCINKGFDDDDDEDKDLLDLFTKHAHFQNIAMLGQDMKSLLL